MERGNYLIKFMIFAVLWIIGSSIAFKFKIKN